MSDRLVRVAAVTALSVVTTAMAARTASAQQPDSALAGAWTIVSITAGEGDKKTEPYGPDVKGTQVFDAGGRFAVVVTRGDLPKVAANNRQKATAEESEKIVHGSIAYFGSYTTNPTDKTMTLAIEGTTFPNWIGTSQTRSYVITGDEMIITNPGASSGGTAKVVLKRAGQKTM